MQDDQAVRIGETKLFEKWVGFHQAPIERIGLLLNNSSLSSSRIDLWLDSFTQLFSGTWTPLFGIGIGQYTYSDVLWEYHYPHNLFLDLAVNAGIPAALILASVLWLSFRFVFSLVKAPIRDTEIKQLSVRLLGLGVVAMISGMITFKFSSNILLWIFIGISARLEKINKKKLHFDKAF